MTQPLDPRKSKWAWDTLENRRIYVGNKSEWDPEETKKRRWTEPIVPGATKAPHGHRVFLSGRLLCCPDLNECGVQVKVIQGEYQDWHYKRVWNRGKNSKYQFKCKNEANVSGVSRFHHTVVNEIHRCLAEGRPVLGKTIAELPRPELPVKELAGKAPDVFVKFDDGSFLAIEVVYTHAPDREVHEQYQENMVDIRLKELDEVQDQDDAAFNRWVQADGVWDLFLKEVDSAQRKARWEARQTEFDVKDEQEHQREVEQRISKCMEEFDFPYGGDKTSVTDLDEINAWFVEERQNRRRIAEIQGAIWDNELRFQTKLDIDPSQFTRKEDVDAHFNEVFKDQIEAERAIAEQRRIEQEALQSEIQQQISELSNELGFTVDRNFATMEDFEAYAEVARKEKKKRERDENRARYNEAYGELKEEFSEFNFTSLRLPTYICNDDQFNNWIQKTRERCEATLTEYKSERAKVFAAFDGFDFNQDELQFEKIPYGHLNQATITQIVCVLFEMESRRRYPEVMKTQTVNFTMWWLKNARRYIPRCDDTISKLLIEFKIGKLLSNLAWDTLLEIVPNYGTMDIDWYREECAKRLTTLVESHQRLHLLDKLENRSSGVLLLIDFILRKTLGEKTDSVLQEYGVEIHSAEGYNFLRTFTPPEGLMSSLIDLVVSPDEKSKAFEKLPKWMTAGDHASLDDVMRSFFQP